MSLKTILCFGGKAGFWDPEFWPPPTPRVPSCKVAGFHFFLTAHVVYLASAKRHRHTARALNHHRKSRGFSGILLGPFVKHGNWWTKRIESKASLCIPNLWGSLGLGICYWLKSLTPNWTKVSNFSIVKVYYTVPTVLYSNPWWSVFTFELQFW